MNVRRSLPRVFLGFVMFLLPSELGLCVEGFRDWGSGAQAIVGTPEPTGIEGCWIQTYVLVQTGESNTQVIAGRKQSVKLARVDIERYDDCKFEFLTSQSTGDVLLEQGQLQFGANLDSAVLKFSAMLHDNLAGRIDLFPVSVELAWQATGKPERYHYLIQSGSSFGKATTRIDATGRPAAVSGSVLAGGVDYVAGAIVFHSSLDSQREFLMRRSGGSFR